MDPDRNLSIASRVRDEHETGTCPECHGIGPCSRYATWFPIIAELPRKEPSWDGDERTWWL